MKFLFDLLPVIFFFGAYKIAGFFPEGSHALVLEWLGEGIKADDAPILIATFIAIVATCLQIAIVWLKHRKVDRMLWVSLFIISILGGLTLAFHDQRFIRWKPTALYWVFGVTLLVADMLFRRNFIRSMLEAQIRLPDKIWSHINTAWALFFVGLGLLNLYVGFILFPVLDSPDSDAAKASNDAWVNFKVFICPVLVLLFSLAQGLYLSKHLIEDEPEK